MLAAAYPLAVAPKAATPLAVPGVAGVAIVAVALALRREWLAVVGTALLALAYGLALFIRGSALDARVPLYAALLLLVAELAAWSCQEGVRIEIERGVWLARAGALAAVAAASVAAAAVVLGAGGARFAGGLAWEATGVAAAVGAFALLAALGRRA